MDRHMQTPAQTFARALRKFNNPLPLNILDALLGGLVVLVVCGALAAHAQQNPALTPPPGSIGENPRLNSPGNTPADPTLRHMTQQMALKRNSERQQQIISDTAHLLQLAQQLNDEVSKTNKNTLSISVVKKADEIEKLAKSIKDKMRDGS